MRGRIEICSDSGIEVDPSPLSHNRHRTDTRLGGAGIKTMVIPSNH